MYGIDVDDNVYWLDESGLFVGPLAHTPEREAVISGAKPSVEVTVKMIVTTDAGWHYVRLGE